MVTQWRYGDAGDVYRVTGGSRWAVGPHQLVCNDLEDNPYPFGPEFAPALSYADPPWNPGNAKMFRTKNGEPDRSVDFDVFLTKLVTAVKNTVGDVFIEMGVKETPHLREIIQREGGKVSQVWPITYYGTKPCVLVQCQWHAGAHVAVPDMTFRDDHRTDENTCLTAILAASKAGDIVFDPCTGRGHTAVMSDRAGRVFYGSELNPRRMAVTIEKLVKRGHKAERIS